MSHTAAGLRDAIDTALKSQDFATAERLSSDLASVESLEEQDRLHWSLALKSLQRLDEALEVLASEHGQGAEYWIQRGKLRRDLGDHAGALEEYQQALVRDPSCHMAHCQRGIVFELLGQFGEASAGYRAALELDADNGMYWMGLAKCLKFAGDEHAAESAFERAEQLLVHDTAYNRACLASLRGSLKRAQALLAEFCGSRPFAAEWARQDPDLAALRATPGFEAATRGQTEGA
jgi:tetratricopeptide (TPR) repeat protein